MPGANQVFYAIQYTDDGHLRAVDPNASVTLPALYTTEAAAQEVVNSNSAINSVNAERMRVIPVKVLPLLVEHEIRSTQDSNDRPLPERVIVGFADEMVAVEGPSPFTPESLEARSINHTDAPFDRAGEYRLVQVIDRRTAVTQ